IRPGVTPGAGPTGRLDPDRTHARGELFGGPGEQSAVATPGSPSTGPDIGPEPLSGPILGRLPAREPRFQTAAGIAGVRAYIDVSQRVVDGPEHQLRVYRTAQDVCLVEYASVPETYSVLVWNLRRDLTISQILNAFYWTVLRKLLTE